MRKALPVCFIFPLLCFPLICYATANGAASSSPQFRQNQQDQQTQQDQPPYDQTQQEYIPYSPDQLDNLLAPIALYPDPLLAQVLPAATFPDEIDDAARYVRAYGEYGIDDQPWDISVRAVAHYPEVLDMMDEKLDWTTAVGQAYVNQSTDVMESIQRLRTLAYNQDNLASNADWQIVDQDGYIQIWPVSPEFIYVPVYDPGLIYYHRCYYDNRFEFGFTFGRAFYIGVWLNRDTDWRNRRIYYTGWRGDEAWQVRCRPFVQRNDVHIRNVYINNRVTNITINQTVVNRTVNVTNINSYNSVHRNVNFNSVANRGVIDRRPTVSNQVVNRNINTGDPRLNQFRGHQAPALPGPPREQVRPEVQQRPAVPTRVFPPQQRRPEQQSRPQTQPQREPQPQPRPQFQMQQRPPQQFQPPQAAQNGPHVFGRSEGAFNPRTAQQRGAQSRQQMSRPVRTFSPPRAAPRPSRPAPSRPHGRGGAQ